MKNHTTPLDLSTSRTITLTITELEALRRLLANTTFPIHDHKRLTTTTYKVNEAHNRAQMVRANRKRLGMRPTSA